jgi:hypothetical protein
MTPREHPAPGSLPTRAECIARAAAIFAAARQERDELFARAGGGREGALAVGRAAWPRDPRRAAAVAEKYLGWVEEDRAKREAARGSAA